MSFNSDLVGIGQNVFQDVKVQTVNVTHVDFSQSPYTVAEGDNILLADATDGQVVINFLHGDRYPNQTFTVKKVDSSPNLISIVPIDLGVTIVLNATYNIDQPDETAQFIYDPPNLNWALMTQDVVFSSVNGPPSSTNNAIAVFNGTAGNVLKNSLATVDGTGILTTPGLSAEDITSTGDLIVRPAGDATNGNMILQHNIADGLKITGRGYYVADRINPQFNSSLALTSQPGLGACLFQGNYGKDDSGSAPLHRVVYAVDKDEPQAFPIVNYYYGISTNGRLPSSIDNFVLTGKQTNVRDLRRDYHYSTLISGITKDDTWYFENNISAKKGILYSQLAASPANDALWVKNTTPSTLQFTNSAGTDFVVPSKKQNLVEVAKSGGDFTTVTAALAYVSTQSPSSTNLFYILIYPGVYDEPLFIIPEYVSLGGLNKETSILQFSTATDDDLITPTNNVVIENLTIDGIDTSNVGILVQNNVDGPYISNIRLINLDRGINCTSTGKFTIIGSDLQNIDSYGVYAATGSNSTILNCNFTNITIMCIRTLSTCIVKNCYIDGSTNGIGIFSASVDIKNTHIKNCTTGLSVSSGSTVHMLSVWIENSLNYDIDSNNVNNTIYGQGIIAQHSKFLYGPTDSLTISFADETENDKHTHILGELHVGDHIKGSESRFGQGDSHTNEMKVFTYLSIYTDKTAAAISFSGSTFNLWETTAPGNIVYIGGGYVFYGLTVKQTAAISMGTGSVIWEYFDGALWQPFKVMSALASTPFTQTAQNCFTTTSPTQIRFGNMVNWAKTNINFQNLYWVRYRIVTAILTAPIIEQIKMQTSHSEFNDDGTAEQFGNAQPNIDYKLYAHLGGVKNADITFAPGFLVEYADNSFQDTDLNRISYTLPILGGQNTAFDITVELWWLTSISGGDVEMQHSYLTYTEGTVVGGLTAISGSFIKVGVVASTVYKNTFTIAVADNIPGEKVILQLARDAQVGNPNDTNTGDVSILDIKITGRSFKNV